MKEIISNKVRTVMRNHEESKMQQQCVAWFRAQYPQYAMLLTHPINEGGRNTRVSGAIHKGEGTVAGVSDLLFFMPARYRTEHGFGPTYQAWEYIYHMLGIEFKTAKGKQSQEQKDFQKMFEAAENKYIVIRSFEQFRKEINDYIAHIDDTLRRQVACVHVGIKQAAEQKEKERFYKIIGKK
jgi:hypothetical protein